MRSGQFAGDVLLPGPFEQWVASDLQIVCASFLRLCRAATDASLVLGGGVPKVSDSSWWPGWEPIKFVSAVSRARGACGASRFDFQHLRSAALLETHPCAVWQAPTSMRVLQWML
mmetsp:Transcript_19556/g.63279  ORF Transcript_19556/g.63279 Transcript_19556/m.63279 type:complete len:115 (+) Transcript_19556:658-1002(+)